MLPRLADTLRRYSKNVTGTLDEKRRKEIDFYDWIARDGITDDAVAKSAAKFRRVFER